MYFLFFSKNHKIKVKYKKNLRLNLNLNENCVRNRNIIELKIHLST